MARAGRLYPSVILHGLDEAARREAALGLARCLLCDSSEPACGSCRHCRRVAWPDAREARFHPDFQVLERDLKTSTSVEATRAFLRGAQVPPHEAEGQVFVVASAESLSGEAANAFLKTLEEPHLGSPRHFLLLAPSSYDLLPTLRSRSMAVYLGAGGALPEAAAERVGDAFRTALAAVRRSGNPIDLMVASTALEGAGNWKDPRAAEPWAIAAAAVMGCAREAEAGSPLRRSLLALAEDLLVAPGLRLRGIPPRRILDGLAARHLTPR